VGAPYLAHAAAAQQLHQAVATERRPIHSGMLAIHPNPHSRLGS
jgi:hypothetical protein